MDDEKPVHDYSSPALEETRRRKAEEERREAIENYNQSTFGERRPIASMFLRIAVFLALEFMIIWFLPRQIGRPLFWVVIVGFPVYLILKHGWPGPPSWSRQRWW